VDLSAIIFVVLALAWAVYLIPKALKHHDEMASDRLVEGHSDKVRILSRHGKKAVAAEKVVETTVVETATPVLTQPDRPQSRPAPRVTLAAARKAAQRRRRVLGLLVLALAVVWGLTRFAYLPIWAPAVPGALVVAWLVVARLSVRSQQARRARAPAVAAPIVEERPRVETTDRTDALVEQLADEDTAGIAREDIEAVLADDGSLWDPLPLTLPTYVNKARARRTVRTIELTGITSSGHDQADTSLAREAAESAQEAAQAATDIEAAQRKAAGA
jgi:hypothetical protein